MRCSVFTLQKNEDFHLPKWIAYYSKHFKPEDMYILDHQSDSDVTKTLDKAKVLGINVVPVECEEVFNHEWLLNIVHGMQQKLLEDYDYVIYTDADELVLPVGKTLKQFLKSATGNAYRCLGVEIMEDKMHRNDMFNKTLISKVPLEWAKGYHTATPEVPVSEDLLLVHLHKMDFNEAWKRNQRWATKNWNKEAVQNGLSSQNQITDYETFRKWFYDTKGHEAQPIPDYIKEVL